MNNSKTVIITGGNSGLGYECARVLAQQGGWHIVIASRNMGRVDAAVRTLQTETGYQAISGMQLDLGSLASVRAFAAAFKTSDLPPLRAIACNAGLSPAQSSTTADGFDQIFGVNHLGHYLLVHLLTAELQQPARVVFVSSGTHLPDHKLARRTGVPAPKYTTARHLAFQEQAPPEAQMSNMRQRYSTSKLCNVLCAYEFDRQFKRLGMQVNVYALDPGLMPGTGLARDVPEFLRVPFFGVIRFLSRWIDGIREADQSGRDLAWLLTDPSLEPVSGTYYDGQHEVPSSADSYDVEKAADLWNTSTELCQLLPEETVIPIQVAAS